VARAGVIVSGTGLPSVCVVLPTRDRPQLLRQAIASVGAQDYRGEVTCLVVHDGTEPDRSVEHGGARPVRVLPNARTAGLAGARNTGILATDADYVAFCDDDDEWLPGKLTAQVDALAGEPDAVMASCSILVQFDDRENVRLAGRSRVTHGDLLRSRMAMLHSSTFLFRREALIDRVGLVDENIPGSQNEDWDLLLRVSSLGPIVHVDQPLVRVLWGTTSFYSRQWQTKIAALRWMLARHPDIRTDRVGSARVYGQLAFAHACAGEPGQARSWAYKAIRRHPKEWRAPVALAVAARLTTGERVLSTLHRHGRGV
jgi:glycosyltransferase involved in cell wall biosynthesis